MSAAAAIDFKHLKEEILNELGSGSINLLNC